MKSRKALMVLILWVGCIFVVHAEPKPGDVFREYYWKPKNFLRVGGSLDYGGDMLAILIKDVEHATKMEVYVQKLLCHGKTKGLAISINENPWLVFPEGAKVPEPAHEYQHFTYPSVEVPLSQLYPNLNGFKLKVDETEGKGWPQNLIYGIIFRVYYDAGKKAHVKAGITSPKVNAKIKGKVTLTATVEGEAANIKQVDFLGNFRDFNYEGDGVYRQWHYTFIQDKIKYHLGSDTTAPYEAMWNTEWIPDQDEPMEFCARVVDKTNLVVMSPAVTGVRFGKRKLKVKMYEPYEVPKLWVTRLGEKSCKVDVPKKPKLKKAVDAQMVWTSWCAGYATGVFLNDSLVVDKPTKKRYKNDYNVFPVKLDYIKTGTNVIRTGVAKKGKHGMEVNWPGMVLFVRYK